MGNYRPVRLPQTAAERGLHELSDSDALRAFASGSSGGIVYADSNGCLATEPAKLFWNPTSDRMGIGTASPQQDLHVASAAATAASVFLVTNSTNSNFLGLWSGHTTTLDPAIAYPSTGALRFGTWTSIGVGWSEKMRISLDGKVGIGTTGPTNLLHIAGTGASFYPMKLESSSNQQVGMEIRNTARIWLIGNTLDNNGDGKLFIHDQSATATRLVIDTAGKVGIGCSNPAQLLEVRGSTNARIRVATTAGSSTATFETSKYQSNDTASIAFMTGETADWDIADRDSENLYFRSTPASPNVRMMIRKSDGFVGIGGVSSPTELLSVARDLGTGYNRVASFLNTNTGATDTFIGIGKGTSTDDGIAIGWDSANNALWMGVNGDGCGTGIVQKRGGRVGIGTTNPQTALHVYGGGSGASGIMVENSCPAFTLANATVIDNAAGQGRLFSKGPGPTTYGSLLLALQGSNGGGGGVWTPALTITATANVDLTPAKVGINSTSPAAMLDVRGTYSGTPCGLFSGYVGIGLTDPNSNTMLVVRGGVACGKLSVLTQSWTNDLYVASQNVSVTLDGAHSSAADCTATFYMQGRTSGNVVKGIEYKVSKDGLATFRPSDQASATVAITQSGNFNIGTTTAGSSFYYATGRGPTYDYFTIDVANSDASGMMINTWKSRGTLASRSTVLNGDELFAITSSCYTGGSGGPPWQSGLNTAAQISVFADGTVSPNISPGRIAFFTCPLTGGAIQERMRITASGDVAIGTTAPAARLHVRKGAGAGGNVSDSNAICQYDSDTNATNFWFNGKTSGAGGTNMTFGFATAGTVRHGITYNTAGNWLAITHDGGNPTPTAGLFVDSASRIGIGTSSPSANYLLTVNGRATITADPSVYPCLQVNATDGGPCIQLKQNDAAHSVILDFQTSGSAIAAQFGYSNFAGVPPYSGNFWLGQLASGSKFVVITAGDYPALSVNQSDGKVGIGTTSPSYRLHVYDDQNAGTGFRVDNPNTGTSSHVKFELASDASVTANWYLTSANYAAPALRSSMVFQINGTSASCIAFGTADAGGTNFAERMRITKDGKVAIGRTDPSQNLDVLGAGDVGMNLGTSTTGAASIYLNCVHQSGGKQAQVVFLQSAVLKGSIGYNTYSNCMIINDTVSCKTVINAVGGVVSIGSFTTSNEEFQVYCNRISTYNQVAIINTRNAGDGHSGITIAKGADGASAAVKFCTGGSSRTDEWDCGAIDDLRFTIRDIHGGANNKIFTIEQSAPNNTLAIKSDGKVGIGTGSPAHKLDVSGDFAVKTHSAFAGSESVVKTAALQTTDENAHLIHAQTLADNTLYWIELHLIGRDTAGVHRAYYVRTLYAYRQGGGANIGTIVALVNEETSDWNVTIAAGSVNVNDIEIKVIGAASTTINWVATVKTQAVSGNS